jgi:serine/threonine-protein kinase
LRPGLSPELDAIVLRGLQRERQNRYKTARELAIALERETETVSATVLGDWVSQVWGAGRVAREEQLREIENAEGTVYLVRPGSAGGDRVRARTPRETASPRRGTLPREQRHDAKEPSTASTVALARVKQDVAVVAPPRPGAPGRRAVSKPSPPSRAVGRARWTGAIPFVLAVAASLLTVAVLEHARVGRTRKNPAPHSLGAAPMSPAARIERLPAMAIAPLVATHIPPPAASAAVPPPSKSDAPPSTAAAVDVPSGSPTSSGALPVTAPSTMVGAAPASRERACRKCRTPPSGPRESQRLAAFRTLRQRDTAPRSRLPSPAPRSVLASSPRLTTPIELDCTPPFTVDSSGIKRFKLACL